MPLYIFLHTNYLQMKGIEVVVYSNIELAVATRDISVTLLYFCVGIAALHKFRQLLTRHKTPILAAWALQG